MSSIEDLRSALSGAGMKRQGAPTGKTGLVSKWHPTQGITKVAEESSRQKSKVAVTNRRPEVCFCWSSITIRGEGTKNDKANLRKESEANG
jgi:hypothetical protein